MVRTPFRLSWSTVAAAFASMLESKMSIHAPGPR
jgi:hypothetical protein